MDQEKRQRLVPRSTMIVVALVAVVISALLVMPRAVSARLVAEGGLIESSTSVVLGVGALIAAVVLFRRLSLPWLSGTAMWIWGFLRELDFQKKFTYRSVESIGYYIRPHAPWSEKILVLLILLPFAAAGLHLLLLLKRATPRAIAERRAWPIHLLAAAGLAVVARSSEKVMRWIVAEEVCELGFVILIFLAMLDLLSRRGPIVPVSPELPGAADSVRMKDSHVVSGQTSGDNVPPRPNG